MAANHILHPTSVLPASLHLKKDDQKNLIETKALLQFKTVNGLKVLQMPYLSRESITTSKTLSFLTLPESQQEAVNFTRTQSHESTKKTEFLQNVT